MPAYEVPTTTYQPKSFYSKILTTNRNTVGRPGVHSSENNKKKNRRNENLIIIIVILFLLLSFIHTFIYIRFCSSNNFYLSQITQLNESGTLHGRLAHCIVHQTQRSSGNPLLATCNTEHATCDSTQLAKCLLCACWEYDAQQVAMPVRQQKPMFLCV